MTTTNNPASDFGLVIWGMLNQYCKPPEIFVNFNFCYLIFRTSDFMLDSSEMVILLMLLQRYQELYLPAHY